MPVWASIAGRLFAEHRVAHDGVVQGARRARDHHGRQRHHCELGKLHGIVVALGGAIGFAFGTVFAKKLPIQMPLSSAAWQILIGCLPITLIGLAIETQLGWSPDRLCDADAAM